MNTRETKIDSKQIFPVVEKGTCSFLPHEQVHSGLTDPDERKKTLGRQKSFEFENNLLTKVTRMFSKTQKWGTQKSKQKAKRQKQTSLSTQKWK